MCCDVSSQLNNPSLAHVQFPAPDNAIQSDDLITSLSRQVHVRAGQGGA